MIPPQFKKLRRLPGGTCPSSRPGSDLTGCIDHSGRFVIEPRFRDFLRFSEGLAPAEEPPTPGERLRIGYVDKTGSWAIEPQYLGAERFSEGLALVGLSGGAGENLAYVDTRGEIAFFIDLPGGDRLRLLTSTSQRGSPPGRVRMAVWGSSTRPGAS